VNRNTKLVLSLILEAFMNRELNPTQAFRLGRLYYGSELQMPLSAYAYAQSVILADLMAWKKRLIV
tara:strand:- start:3950 stop:4147 length:198 start_codon:yes stop_codon:yes gene_type:complete